MYGDGDDRLTAPIDLTRPGQMANVPQGEKIDVRGFGEKVLDVTAVTLTLTVVIAIIFANLQN